MRRRLRLLTFASLTLFVACGPSTPAPSPTPIPTPLPTPTPSPMPTATPVPRLALSIRWPERVSALEPVPIEVKLLPSSVVTVTATVSTAVLDPEGVPYCVFELAPREDAVYAAEERLRLPLEPMDGDWRLRVNVRSALQVEGKRELVFSPEPIRFRELAGDLPRAFDIRVPQAFVEVLGRGDPVAGGRVWRYGGGELAVWWAPGPVEPLLIDNAVVMLEASLDSDGSARVLDVDETEWQGQTAFMFREAWPGAEGGPARVLVVQGADYRLYLLRVRALGGEAIPPLLRQVWETFTFVED